jgi:hypothetical protein
MTLERPLVVMQPSQERLYQVCQLIERVATCILDYASCELPMELFDAMELVGRLDLAVEVIRQENGASR